MGRGSRFKISITRAVDKQTSHNPPELDALFVSETPIGRLAEPGEIARPVLFLLSSATDLLVDGGFTAR